MNKLAGKNAVITGGGSGIGLATAQLLLDAGARVAITGRDKSKLEQAAAMLKAGDRLLCHAADISDPEQVNRLMQHVLKQWDVVDILVNNAGMNIKERGIRELTPATWRTMTQANLDGAFFCIHALLPHMLARNAGLIINVSSVAGKRANPLGGAAYAAAKFGMSALGICLAEEVRDSNIRVSNIYPGEVDTPILVHRPKPVTEEHRQRILQPQDVAEAILFVATLPPRVSVPELVIKPTAQSYI